MSMGLLRRSKTLLEISDVGPVLLQRSTGKTSAFYGTGCLTQEACSWARKLIFMWKSNSSGSDREKSVHLLFPVPHPTRIEGYCAVTQTTLIDVVLYFKAV